MRGMRFGKILVVGPSPSQPFADDTSWECHCDCGKIWQHTRSTLYHDRKLCDCRVKHVVPDPDTKLCLECLQRKPLREFGRRSRRADKLHTKCKECERKHKKPPKRRYGAQTELRRRRQARYWQLHPPQCRSCGEPCTACLVFHHVDPSAKEASISKLWNSRPRGKELAEELSKCVVICANCHAKVHAGLLDVSKFTPLEVTADYLDSPIEGDGQGL